jgi:CsoR family transcriptional regulator, copper-sensing transcriptional repressor
MEQMDNKKADLKARLARIEGQIRAVQRLIDEEAECEVVAQQLAAARKALNKAFFDMMSCAIERELGDSALTAKQQAHLEKMTELLVKYG